MMITAAESSANQGRVKAVVTVSLLVLILFAPALWRFLVIAILPRGLDNAFFSFQMPLLQGALAAILLWPGFAGKTGSHVSGETFAEAYFPATSKALYPLMAVLVLGFLSALFSDVALFSVLHQARWFIWGSFIVALAAYVAGGEGEGEGEGRAKLIIDLILGGFLFYAAFFHVLVFTLDPEEVRWLYQMPGYANIRFFGQYATAALMLSYYPLFKAKADLRLMPMVLRTLPVALCWAMVLWSGSRASTMAAVMTLGALAVSGHMRRPGYVAIVTLFAITLAVMWSFVIGTGGADYGLFRILGSIQRVGNIETAEFARIAMWLETMAAIPGALLLGHGPGSLSFTLSADQAMYFHPHNLVLQALFDWGVVIGTGFLGVLAWLGWRILRAPARCGKAEVSAEVTAGFAVVSAMSIASMLDGNFYHPDPLMLAGVGLALAAPATRPVVRSFSLVALPRWTGAALSVGIAACFALYLTAGATMAVIGSRGAPAPDSLRAKFVQTLPYSFYDTFGIYSYSRWIDQWVEGGAEQGTEQPSAQMIEAELTRVDRYSRWEVPKQLVAVRRVCARGDRAAALAMLDALDHDHADAVGDESAYLRQALDDFWGGCRASD